MGGKDFRMEALSGLERLDAATGPSDVLNILELALKPFGAEFFCINFLPAPHQQFSDVLLAHRVPGDWLQLYLDKQFCSVDPSLRHCRHTTQPFEYLDLPFDRDTEPAAEEVIRCAGEFDLSRGFVVPIPGPTGCEGNVWIGGYHLKLAAAEKPVVHLLSLYAFESVGNSAVAVSQKSRSSRRENERSCIGSPRGKSAWEIGEILHISKRTVDEHSAKAARKLNAANRVQAVAQAIRYRLIQP